MAQHWQGVSPGVAGTQPTQPFNPNLLPSLSQPMGGGGYVPGGPQDQPQGPTPVGGDPYSNIPGTGPPPGPQWGSAAETTQPGGGGAADPYGAPSGPVYPTFTETGGSPGLFQAQGEFGNAMGGPGPAGGGGGGGGGLPPGWGGDGGRGGGFTGTPGEKMGFDPFNAPATAWGAGSTYSGQVNPWSGQDPGRSQQPMDGSALGAQGFTPPSGY